MKGRSSWKSIRYCKDFYQVFIFNEYFFRLDESFCSWSQVGWLNAQLKLCTCYWLYIELSLKLNWTIYLKIYKIRPKLGRSCRCILMLGHGYEPVVDFVLLILNYSNFPTSLTTLYSTLMSLNFVIKNIFLTPLDITLLSRNVFKLKCLVPLHPFQPYWNSHLN